MQGRNPRLVHPAVPHHRLTRRLVTPNITEPFKVIAVQLGNSISRLRPITKGMSIRFIRNAGIQRQRRSTRYTLVVYRTHTIWRYIWLIAYREGKGKVYYITESNLTQNFLIFLNFQTFLIFRYQSAIYIDLVAKKFVLRVREG